MFRKIKCMENTIRGECNKREIKEIYHQISINNENLKTIDIYHNKVKKYIEAKNLEKILKLDMKKIDENDFANNNTKNKGKLPCKLNPYVCEINIKIEKSILEKQYRGMKEKINTIMMCQY